MRNFISYIAASVLLFSAGLFAPSYAFAVKAVNAGASVTKEACDHLKQEIARLNKLLEAKYSTLKGLINRRVHLYSLKKKDCSSMDLVCQTYNAQIQRKIVAVEKQIASTENLISIIRKRLAEIYKELAACLSKEPISEGNRRQRTRTHPPIIDNPWETRGNDGTGGPPDYSGPPSKTPPVTVGIPKPIKLQKIPKEILEIITR